MTSKTMSKRVIFFDTETTGLPRNRAIPALDRSHNWPDLVELCWKIFEEDQPVRTHSYVILPQGWTIPAEAAAIHGITQERAEKEGTPLLEVMERFVADVCGCYLIVAHNLEFDRNVIFQAVKWRLGMDPRTFWPSAADEFCTLRATKEEDAAEAKAKQQGGQKKSYTLSALYLAQFGESFSNAHSATADVDALQRYFWARWNV